MDILHRGSNSSRVYYELTECTLDPAGQKPNTLNPELVKSALQSAIDSPQLLTTLITVPGTIAHEQCSHHTCDCSIVFNQSHFLHLHQFIVTTNVVPATPCLCSHDHHLGVSKCFGNRFTAHQPFIKHRHQLSCDGIVNCPQTGYSGVSATLKKRLRKAVIPISLCRCPIRRVACT